MAVRVRFRVVTVIARCAVLVLVGMVVIVLVGVAVIARRTVFMCVGTVVLVPVGTIVIVRIRPGMARVKARFIGFPAVSGVGVTHDGGFRGGFVV
jgi:hypothetical protein